MTIAERIEKQNELMLEAIDKLYACQHVNDLHGDLHDELAGDAETTAAWLARAAARAPMNSTLHQKSIADEAYWRTMRVVCDLRIASANEQYFNTQARKEYGEIAEALLRTSPLVEA